MWGCGALLAACGGSAARPSEVSDASPPDQTSAPDAAPTDGAADTSAPDGGGRDTSAPDGGAPDALGADHDEIRSGGAATVLDNTRNAFGQPVPGLAPAREDDFFVGNAIFNRGWVIAPASVRDMDGLGPVFNATNCSGCHLRDGRGRPPERDDERFLSLLLRISVPGADAHGGPKAEPTYGLQIQTDAIPGVPAEARPRVSYEEKPGTFPDGEPYSLRQPRYTIEVGGAPLAADVRVSPRVAQHLVGLGLLEAVPDADLLAAADPDDRDGDGISGRPNFVWDVARGARGLGRFGWKANQPSLRQQSAGAFNGDIGITSALFPDEACTAGQTECLAAPRGSEGAPELRAEFLDSVVAYVSTLAVPARRRLDAPDVQRGKAVFTATGCAACHTPKLRTGVHPSVPELSQQTIRPYTDLLLHDMGPGLADDRPDFEATGSEWRTPPLWGLGLVPAVNRHELYLHDGRARGFVEAILWHGGEAEASRTKFVNLPKADRDALVAFLKSL